jgi:hypothetical protein
MTSFVMGHAMPPLLREAYPQHAAKRAAAAADVPIETARTWVRGRAAPSAERLLLMADRCDAMAAALEARLRRRRADPAGSVAAAAGGAGAAADGGGGS